MSAVLSPVETIKAESRGLRGTLVESLADAWTGALREPDQTLLKFHGSYQQDDRDLREERAEQKLEPNYSFMIRTRTPGGVVSPAQWLAFDAIARRYGGGSLRLTTRQAIQLHGVIKRELKATLQAINQSLIDTIAACGDVNRNVLVSANPIESAAHAQVYADAVALSEALLPKTRAYHEIWLDEEPVAGTPEHEPLYGPTYLPRKFKTAFVVPPQNDVDVYAHDLGYVAIVEDGVVLGYNVTVGGGLGMTHGDARTYARAASVLGYVPRGREIAVAEAVLTTQRDHGDRADRRLSRLKYTIDRLGVDWFRAEVERRSGVAFEAARPVRFTARGDRFGWIQGSDGRWHLTLRLSAGRIADRHDGQLLSALRQIAEVHRGDFRITANQNLIVAGIAPEDRPEIERLFIDTGLAELLQRSPLELNALACVALPTCPLAMAEAERYLKEFSAQVQALLARHGVPDESVSLRLSGCPNGCSRPYLAEIALVGKAPGRYNLQLGGDAFGERLNRLYRENIDVPEILRVLDQSFARWLAERHPAEAFGDFAHRVLLTETAA
ncbi:MAG: assimilatory sulfite reductase (NADPH) hemoprotein subunit [Xanthomonadales bacterium]|nr:assimilatory sulfite reductase (NADPH) hemoprotein subunit [Xanthomonadales bacterium]MCB1611943.1 assimilatory sulfite reductase (NADPH) hemoprotein subunit [Xanthomonadales bacterium]